MKLNFKGETLTRRWSARGCDPRAWRAFTLLEILVVLAIMGLLAGLAIASLGQAHRNAEKATARLMVDSTLKTALDLYRISVYDYPSNADGLDALVRRSASASPRWSGPYLDVKTVPVDPWGEPYLYAYPGQHRKDGYDLWSKGPDRQSGTEDDITNWGGK